MTDSQTDRQKTGGLAQTVSVALALACGVAGDVLACCVSSASLSAICQRIPAFAVQSPHPAWYKNQTHAYVTLWKWSGLASLLMRLALCNLEWPYFKFQKKRILGPASRLWYSKFTQRYLKNVLKIYYKIQSMSSMPPYFFTFSWIYNRPADALGVYFPQTFGHRSVIVPMVLLHNFWIFLESIWFQDLFKMRMN